MPTATVPSRWSKWLRLWRCIRVIEGLEWMGFEVPAKVQVYLSSRVAILSRRSTQPPPQTTLTPLSKRETEQSSRCGRGLKLCTKIIFLDYGRKKGFLTLISPYIYRWFLTSLQAPYFNLREGANPTLKSEGWKVNKRNNWVHENVVNWQKKENFRERGNQMTATVMCCNEHKCHAFINFLR